MCTLLISGGIRDGDVNVRAKSMHNNRTPSKARPGLGIRTIFDEILHRHIFDQYHASQWVRWSKICLVLCTHRASEGADGGGIWRLQNTRLDFEALLS